MSFDPMILSNAGRVGLLEATRAYRQKLTLRLFINDISPYPDMMTGAFQEATFPGYHAVAVTSWSVAYLNNNGEGQSDAPVVSFVANAAGPEQWAYGVFYTDTGGNWVWAHRRAEGPKRFALAGDELAIVPSIRDTQLPAGP